MTKIQNEMNNINHIIDSCHDDKHLNEFVICANPPKGQFNYQVRRHITIGRKISYMQFGIQVIFFRVYDTDMKDFFELIRKLYLDILLGPYI